MAKILENIASTASSVIDSVNVSRVMTEYSLAEKYRLLGDVKNYRLHRKELRKYYYLILDKDTKKIVRNALRNYFP